MTRPKGQRKNLVPPTPKSIKTGYSRNDKPFRWTLTESFWEHSGWADCKDAQFFAEHIINKLQDFEKMTWQEIEKASGGKSEGHGNNNHFIASTKLPADECAQFIKHEYMRKYDQIFSLRLSGQERLIGVVDLNVFKILWFDAKHKFF